MSSSPVMKRRKFREGLMGADVNAIAKLDPDRVVDNRTYVDPRVFELERERILARAWMLVGHASELASPGDYLTATVAGGSIVVTRNRDGELKAMHNVCRHRGSQVVNDVCGHASTLRCPYHFWTYSLDGDLVGIPGEEAYDGTGFQKEDFPLQPVRVDAAHGLVFVCLSEDTDPLEDWLGPEIVEWLAKPFANPDLNVIARNRSEYEINWKVFAENARDGYHVPFVHPFFRKASPPGMYHLYRNSHAVQELGMDLSSLDPQLADDLVKVPFDGVAPTEGYIVNIFPDMAITLRSNVCSLDWQEQVSPTKTVFHQLVIGVDGDDEETQRLRRLSHQTWFANPVELEDVPVFYAQQAGVASPFVLHSVIARGQPTTEGTRGDDNRLRHFWTTWRRLMGVEVNSVPEVFSDA